MEVEEERSHLLDFFEEQDSAWSFQDDTGDDTGESDTEDMDSRFDSKRFPYTTNMPRKHGSTKLS